MNDTTKLLADQEREIVRLREIIRNARDIYESVGATSDSVLAARMYRILYRELHEKV